MKFTLSWLKRFLDTDCSAVEIGDHLTALGLELEELVDSSATYASFIVAEITGAVKHPDADSLQVCKVFDGKQELQIVCSAPNARTGIKVALAPLGSIIPSGNFKIKPSKIRGVESDGMMCSENEIGISDEQDGNIIEMPEDAVIGSRVAPYYGLDDPVFEIAITPNRADCLGVYGIARDLAAKGVGVLKPLDIQDVKGDFNSDLVLENAIEDKCPLFTAFEVRDIKNAKSPEWLQFLLKNVGCNSVSTIVDITNYICLSFGQPMHGYDAEQSGGVLKVDNGHEGEEFEALNDKSYKLAESDIIVYDAKGASCIAGVMGSNRSACTLDTSAAYIECALFDKVATSMSGRRLQIDSDARYRFERGVDPEFTISAAKIAMQMFKDIAGAEISNLLITGKASADKRVIEIDSDFIEQKLGLKLDNSQIIAILEKLGFECKNSTKLEVAIPSWRADVTIAEDLVEEIARLYGYDNLPVIKLQREEVGRLTPLQRRIQDGKRLLATNGYNEVVSWSFMDSKLAKLFTTKGELAEHLYLSNPISDVLDYMRPSIMGNLLQMVHKNISRSISDLALFEIGPIFQGGIAGNIDNYAEKQIVTGIRSGNMLSRNIHSELRGVDVYDVKSDVHKLLKEYGVAVDKLRIDTTNLPAYYHPGRSAKLCLGKNVLAVFGELHPAILKKFDIDNSVVGFELLIESLPFSKPKRGARANYLPSDFQAVWRDFAFVMSHDIAVGDVLSSMRAIDRELIRGVELFDIYQGEHVEQGSKSVAFSIKIQSNKATLLDDEINNIAKKVEKIMQDKFSATIRG